MVPVGRTIVPSAGSYFSNEAYVRFPSIIAMRIPVESFFQIRQ